MKLLIVIPLFLLISMISIGCGTDVKPTYFTNMFKDESDIDRLSECLAETPQTEGDIITIKANKPCLVDLSKRDTADPNVDASFSEILQNPEKYLGKLVTFEAILEKMHHHQVQLVTNDLELRFYIHSHGKEIYTLDEEGEEISLQPFEKYKFRCRIREMRTHVDLNGAWEIHADFIIFEDKEIATPPEKVVNKATHKESNDE